eukprot:c4261_g1_i1 orf=69-1046(+)
MSMATSLCICSLLLLACHLISPTIASSPTAPAFVWSDHRSLGLHTQGAVDYRVFSPQTLVDTLMQKFGWSSLLCNPNDGGKERLDAVVAFIGNELHSEDIARTSSDDSLPVLRILKEYFSSSSYSMALPYISISTESGGILNTLLSTIKESCNLKSRPGKMLIVGSCLKGTFDPKWPILTEGIELVDNAENVKDFISSRKASRETSETDIIIACPVSIDGLEAGELEGDMLATVLSALRQSGTSNAVLYASDPLGATVGYGYNARMLSSNVTSTSNTTCDDICETVAGVYEGIIVAVTLLIILISGLCCMMGIDTPSRFENSQDS